MASENNKRKLDPSSTPPEGSKLKNKHQKRHSSQNGDKTDECLCCTCNNVANVDVIQCQWCLQWEHRQCAQLSVDEMSILSKVNDRVVFFCTKCYSKVPAALTIKDLSERNIKLNNGLSDFEAKLNELKEELTMQISKCRDMFGSDRETVKPPEIIASTIVTTINEEKDKEKRRLNLIIHNAPESSAESGDLHKQSDTEFAIDIFNNFLGAKAEVSKAIRLGAKSDKPRLLKISRFYRN